MKMIFFWIVNIVLLYADTNRESNATVYDLYKIKTVPYYLGLEAGGDKLFWAIAKTYKNDLDSLTKAFSFRKDTEFIPWRSYTNTIGCDGDIAVLIFSTLVKDIPFLKFAKESGFNTMGRMIAANPKKNREILYNKIKEWYKKNKNKLIWREDNSLYRSKMKNPLGGCYRLKTIEFKKYGNRCL